MFKSSEALTGKGMGMGNGGAFLVIEDIYHCTLYLSRVCGPFLQANDRGWGGGTKEMGEEGMMHGRLGWI